MLRKNFLAFFLSWGKGLISFTTEACDPRSQSFISAEDNISLNYALDDLRLLSTIR